MELMGTAFEHASEIGLVWTMIRGVATLVRAGMRLKSRRTAVSEGRGARCGAAGEIATECAGCGCVVDG